MIIVADASPICYLLLIGEIELFPKLFDHVLVPSAVINELLAEGAPASVREWAAAPPAWISVRDAPGAAFAGLERLHAGEQAAILLAEAAGADLILLDEKSARRVATERGLRAIGLLGVLVDAANRNLVDLPTAIHRLTKTTFRHSPLLLKSILERYAKS